MSLSDTRFDGLLGSDEAATGGLNLPFIELVNAGVCPYQACSDLAELRNNVVGFSGRLVFDACRRDGAPRKSLGVSGISGFGWQRATPLRAALASAYRAYWASVDRGL